MNPQEIQIAVGSMQAIADVLTGLGVPGLIGLALIGPALVLCSILWAEHMHGKRLHAIVEALRIEHRAALEAYRSDMSAALKELGDNQRTTDGYYRANVELVRGYDVLARNLQDVVVSNTRSFERLVTMVETANNFAARDRR